MSPGGKRGRWRRAQQPSGRPVIGYLSVQPVAERPQYVDAFRKGLAEQDFVEGQNLAIEYRAAENRLERLPGLAADLVQRRSPRLRRPEVLRRLLRPSDEVVE